MTNLTAYRWRKRLLFEKSGADQEMPWIDDLARDQIHDEHLLVDLLHAAAKLTDRVEQVNVIRNLSWYVTMKWPCGASLPDQEPWSDLLEIIDTVEKPIAGVTHQGGRPN